MASKVGGRFLKIKEVSGKLCLVNENSGQVLFRLAQKDIHIDAEFGDVAGLRASFILLDDAE